MKHEKPASTARIRELAGEAQAKNNLDEEGRKEHYRRKHKAKKPVDLAREMAEVEKVKDYVKMLSSFINAEYDVIRLELLPQKMEEAGLENMKVENLGRVNLTGDMYVSIRAGEFEEFAKWLKKRKLGDLVQETINSSTLKAFVTRRMADNKDVPRELLNVTPYTRASITRA